MTTRVALVGGTGKLGTIIAEVIEATEGFETVAVLGSASDLGEIDGADLVVDASVPAVSIDVEPHRITIAEAGSSGNSGRSRLPSPAPTASDGAKMPPGTPHQAVSQVAMNFSSV